MNHLLNLIKKELKELLTPGTIVTMLAMVLIFIGMGAMISAQSEQAVSDLTDMKFGYFNKDADDGNDAYSTGHLEYLGGIELTFEDVSSSDAIMSTLSEKELGFILVIDANFSEDIESAVKGNLSVYYNQKGLSMFDSTSSAMASTILAYFNGLIFNQYLEDKGITEIGRAHV